MNPDDKPAYGQVWTYDGGTRFMLVAPYTKFPWGNDGHPDGSWSVLWMYDPPILSPDDLATTPMSGLYDDPIRRLPSFERVA